MELLTPETVSKILNIKTRQVLEMARNGKIPGIKVGKFWRFPEDFLKAWIQRGLSENQHQHDVDSIVEEIISG